MKCKKQFGELKILRIYVQYIFKKKYFYGHLPPLAAGSVTICAKTTVDCSPDSSTRSPPNNGAYKLYIFIYLYISNSVEYIYLHINVDKMLQSPSLYSVDLGYEIFFPISNRGIAVYLNVDSLIMTEEIDREHIWI
jgi:hypothetical protein